MEVESVFPNSEMKLSPFSKQQGTLAGEIPVKTEPGLTP